MIIPSTYVYIWRNERHLLNDTAVDELTHCWLSGRSKSNAEGHRVLLHFVFKNTCDARHFIFSTLGKAFMLSREQLPPWGVREPGGEHFPFFLFWEINIALWLDNIPKDSYLGLKGKKKDEAGKRRLSREHSLAAPSTAFLALLSKWLQFELCRSELHFLCLQLPGLHYHIRMPLSDSVGFLGSAGSKREMRSSVLYNHIISI